MFFCSRVFMYTFIHKCGLLSSTNVQPGRICSRNPIPGEAFEPEERFENPDGTDIIFNEDYLGDHRGVSTIPGPFATSEACAKQIW